MMDSFKFYISQYARKKYHIDRNFFFTVGDIELSDLTLARQLAEQMSRINRSIIPTSEIYALGLINEIHHILFENYAQEINLSLQDAYLQIERSFGEIKLHDAQKLFIDEFPPTLVRQGQESSINISLPINPALILEEMFLLHVINLNPASHSYKDLFDESCLIGSENYLAIIEDFSLLFEISNRSGSENKIESLLEILNLPATFSPDSFTGQLEYLIQRWGKVLGDSLVNRALQSIDLKREETIRKSGTGGSNGEAPLLEFGPDETENEHFSPDMDWMPQLVLIAKNSYVWIDQLSKLYQRPIKYLDQIPDEELDNIAGAGISGLWLIGLWERSRASMRIKQMMGNPDALSSAYSLKDYQIADALGGWQALNNLRERAWQRGIRLSADMVPNHMGIDSNWVMDHPDWFISIPYSPFPNYSYNGEDLSNNDRVGIYLEDHYYNKSDAAVVFKRVEHGSGNVRYIYHGNDGTSMPWNDTAQLDYLKAEVREAVIQTILNVARNFPIIRFDAAMTLASKHVQRLWYPEPGSGGAIPSRSEHGLTHAQFQAAFPTEFWRDVVNRVAQEVPDTLLLAEAFWLMEGYFVRTLGMHRVYNSAFMHMLRDEDNAKYRTVIKNVLEFDPQILKRFVNFMNNPDEKSAIEQFGDGDKYFGICTLLASLPGLPMFGHGQIEGYHEKYGMEYQRAYWDETPNEGLLHGHEWHIFPLLKRRNLFADVQNFVMFDFYNSESQVNEDVFAYSNGIGSSLSEESGQRALIIYHNKFSETQGWIKTSVAFMDKFSGQLTQTSLKQALGLQARDRDYTIFRDLENGLEYIHQSKILALNGLYLELKAYQHHAFIDFREINDQEGKWKVVCDDLKGNGYWSVQARFDELHNPLVIVEEEKLTVKEKRNKDP